jgi:hypothetical protein
MEAAVIAASPISLSGAHRAWRKQKRHLKDRGLQVSPSSKLPSPLQEITFIMILQK